LGGKENVGDGNEHHQSAEEAVLSNSFSVLACCVARSDICHDANPEVVETAEKTVLELVRHFCKKG